MLRIQLLGTIRIEIDAQPITGFRGNRNRSLLTKLLLCSNEPVPRSVLASLLWPESTETQARTNLRRELHTLRQTHTAIDESIVVSRDSLQWRTSSDCECDVDMFVSQCNAFRNAESRSNQLLSGGYALDLYTGDLAQELHDEWIYDERIYLKEKWLGLLEKYIPLLVYQKRLEKAISLLEVFITNSPYKESAYLQLMQAHLLAGNSALAQHAYNRCKTILQRDLNVLPSSELQELHQRLSKKISVKVPRGRVSVDKASPRLRKFIGRRAQLEQIKREINRIAVEGGAHLIMISGHAGMGKTRLIEELFESEGVNPELIPTAYCFETQGERPMHTAMSWIQSDGIDKDISSLCGTSLKVLQRYFPEIFTDVIDRDPGNVGASSKVSGEYTVPLLHAALSELLTGVGNKGVELGSTGSTVRLAFIDDIQWSDQDSLDWLHQLVLLKVDEPLVVLATRRSEATPPGHPVESLCLNLQSRGKLTDYTLGPMSQECSTQLIRDELQELGKTSATFDAVDIGRRAEGNPLFLIELTRYNSTISGSEQEADGSYLFPPRIHAVIQGRINRLSPDAQTLVSIGSVVGRSFSVELVQTVCDFSDELLVGLLDELWHAGLITECGNSEYKFSHDCIREAGYLTLSTPRRRSFHGSIAIGLEQINYFDTRTVSAQIALHWDKAVNSKKAVEWFVKAMDYSTDVLAMRDVIRFGTAALEHIDCGDVNGQIMGARVQILLKLAYARSVTDGFGSSSVEKLCSEIESCERHIYHPSIQFLIASRLRMYHSFSSRLVDALKHTFRQIEIARELGDPLLIIDSYRAKAFVEYQLGRHQASAETARMACELGALCEESGELDVRCPSWALLMSHGIRAHGLHIVGKTNQGREVFAKCHGFESCTGDNHLKGLVLLWMGMYFQSTGNVAESKLVGARTIALGNEYGIEKFVSFGDFFCGWASFCAGDYESAVVSLQQSVDVYKRLDENILFPLLSSHLAQAFLKNGSIKEAEQSCNESLAYARKYKMHAWNSEIFRVQANIAALSKSSSRDVTGIYEQSKKIASKQNATVFLLRTLTDEYEYLLGTGSDTAAVQMELKKLYRSRVQYGKSVELERIENVLDLAGENYVSVPNLGGVQ